MTREEIEVLALKRAMGQCSVGNADLDKAVASFIKIGFVDGYTAGLDKDRVLLEAYRRVVAVARMANDRSPDIRVSNALRSLDEIRNEL